MKIFCNNISEIQWEISPSFKLNNSIHLWLAEVQINSQKIAELKKSLSNDELKRSDRFAFEKDRNQYITAHAVLRNILSKYLDALPEQIQFKKTANKKPFISQPNTLLKFNISHSENKILIAISENEIGVDIEMIKDSFEFNELSKTYFSEKEQNAISNSPDPKLMFYKFWTRKEAVLKASGIGIIDNLKEIEICYEKNFCALFSQDFYIDSFKVGEDFFGSIAFSSVKNIHLFKV